MTYGTTTYYERSVFLSFCLRPPWGLPAGSVTLPAGFGALQAGTEAFLAGFEALPAGSKAHPA